MNVKKTTEEENVAYPGIAEMTRALGAAKGIKKREKATQLVDCLARLTSAGQLRWNQRTGGCPFRNVHYFLECKLGDVEVQLYTGGNSRNGDFINTSDPDHPMPNLPVGLALVPLYNGFGHRLRTGTSTGFLIYRPHVYFLAAWGGTVPVWLSDTSLKNYIECLFNRSARNHRKSFLSMISELNRQDAVIWQSAQTISALAH